MTPVRTEIAVWNIGPADTNVWNSPLGHFYEAWTNGGEDWNRVMVPATECPRISPQFLEEERRSIGDWWFRQEYLCEFVDSASQLFDHADIVGALDPGIRPLFVGARQGGFR